MGFCRIWRLVRAAMSLGQYLLATLRWVNLSGCTVCYSSDKSCDSEMAITWVGRLVGLYKWVFSIIVTLSSYLSAPRVLGVLQGVTCVCHVCYSIFGEDFVCHVCVFRVWWQRTNLSRTIVSSYWVWRYPELLVISYCIGSGGCSFCRLFFLFCVYIIVVFPDFFNVVCLLTLALFFLSACLVPARFWWRGGVILPEGSYCGWTSSTRFAML